MGCEQLGALCFRDIFEENHGGNLIRFSMLRSDRGGRRCELA
jgi:hypothetical protein